MRFFHVFMLVALFAVIDSAQLFAQTSPSTDTESDPDNPLLVAVEKAYQKSQSWRADFVQTTFVEMLGQTLSKNGFIVAARPDKLHVEYTTDPKKVYVTNGMILWVYQTVGTEAHEFEDPKSIISQEALSFLGGLSRASEIFDVIDDLKEPDNYLKIQDKNLKKLFLVPKDEESSILKITLGIDAKTSVLKEAVLFNATGNVTHYVFNKIEFDQKLPEDIFSLPKIPKRKLIKVKD